METPTIPDTPKDQPNISDVQILEIRSLFNKKLMENFEKNNTRNLDLSLVWKETNNLQELYTQLDDLKKCLDSFRPLSENEVEMLNDYFDIEYTYHSNKIEGNTLTKNETNLIINKGITVDKKSFNEHLEAINHKEAIDFIRELVEKDTDFSNYDLLNIHFLVLKSIRPKDAGKYRIKDVEITGSSHTPPPHFKLIDLMEEYFRFYEYHKNIMHPVELSAEMHERLVTIHPFIDGNGRTSRLIMNLILLKNGYPITIIEGDNKKRLEYYDSLELSRDISDNKKTFKLFIAKNVKSMMFKYLNLLSSNNEEDRLTKGGYFFEKIKEIL